MTIVVEAKTACTEALAGNDVLDFDVMVPIEQAYGETVGLKEFRQDLKKFQKGISDALSLMMFTLLSVIMGTVLSLVFGLLSGFLKFFRVYIFSPIQAIIAEIILIDYGPIWMAPAHFFGRFWKAFWGGGMHFYLFHKMETIGELSASTSKTLSASTSSAGIFPRDPETGQPPAKFDIHTGRAIM